MATSIQKKAQLSKRFKCAECGYVYVSPIPIAAVDHKCTVRPKANTTRKGMLPE